MPFVLARAFQRAHTFPVRAAQYKQGEYEASLVAQGAQPFSRKRWRMTCRLAPARLAALRAFYESHGGPHRAFLFYDVLETDPPFSYDETGQAVAGRKVVRFECGWDQTKDIGRGEVSLALVELV